MLVFKVKYGLIKITIDPEGDFKVHSIPLETENLKSVFYACILLEDTIISLGLALLKVLLLLGQPSGSVG